ncbi:MAG: hypothetical protein N2510_09730, partial [Ignavibacteria bacterium]|nr:hypothetical protein [Ignavibacteria bacterium]
HTADPISIELKSRLLDIDPNAGAGEYEIHTEGGLGAVNSIIDLLRSSSVKIKSINQKTSSLEDLFINLIKKDNTN